MSLVNLRAENIRCLKKVVLEPAETNLIFGENASGKTSLLEAIFILGRGRSFRNASREAVITDGQREMLVTGVHRGEDRDVRLGISQYIDRPPRIRVDGKEERSAAALAEILPVQIIDPDVHQLVEEGPGVRRKFLDWGVFHVEPEFLGTWRRYHRLVRQRNAALKTRSTREIDAWDRELGPTGERLTAYRQQYTESLGKHVTEIGRTLLGHESHIIYRQGWSDERTLMEALQETRDRDLKLGVTHAGPHRADLSIQVASRRARGRVSRGQQKLLAATLVLAQLAHLRFARAIQSVLLLDDLAAELDTRAVGRLKEVVGSLEAQLFLTALRRPDLADWNCAAVFHVEQGKVLSVV